VYLPQQNRMLQLSDQQMETFVIADEGNAEYGLGTTDKGQRVALQWTGSTLKTAYAVNINTGERRLLAEKLDGNFFISPKGRFIYWFSQPFGKCSAMRSLLQR
jgi:hypothetical protein